MNRRYYICNLAYGYGSWGDARDEAVCGVIGGTYYDLHIREIPKWE